MQSVLQTSFVLCLIVALNVDALSHHRYKNVKTNHRFHINNERPEELRAMTTNCDSEICINVPNYPENQVKTILEENKVLHSFFGEVIRPIVKVMLHSRLDPRYGPEESFCKTLEHTIQPKAMRDTDNIERIIANVDGFHQTIKYEVCRSGNNHNCSLNSALNYETTCKQNYNIIKLLTMDTETNVASFRNFMIPSTCVCVKK